MCTPSTYGWFYEEENEDGFDDYYDGAFYLGLDDSHLEFLDNELEGLIAAFDDEDEF